MKLKQFKMNLKTPLILFLSIFLCFNSFAQTADKKWSAGIGMGFPITFFSIKSNLVGIYAGSARYSFNKSWSLEGKLTSNTFYAKTTNPSKTTLNGTTSDVLSYRTPIYGLNLIGYRNFHGLFGLIKKVDSPWLPYASFGIGMNWYKPSANFANNTKITSTTFGKPFRDYQLGIGTRYFLNSNMDVYGGLEYHISETYYLDAFKEANAAKLDQYLNIYLGVSFKVGAKPWNNLVDWSFKNIENPKESTKIYSKWAVDGTVGVPFMLTPIGHGFTGMFNIGLRHSFNKAMSLQLMYGHGNVKGSQTVSGTNPIDVKDFVTRLNQYDIRAFFNLRNLTKEPMERTDWNHYAIVGAGYIYGNQDATYADGRKTSAAKVYAKSGLQTFMVGYEARKYLTHAFDLILGVDYNHIESKYLDAYPNKSGVNSIIYTHAGVTYKIGTSKDKEHIDWSYGSYNNYKDKSTLIEQVPVIEKPAVKEQPKIEEPKIAVAPPVVPEKKPEVVPVPEPVVPPAPPVVEPPAPKPVVVTPAPKPAPKVITAPVVVPAKTEPAPYIPSLEVGPPPMQYNVIVACYSVNKLKVAELYKAKLEKKGFAPSIYRSNPNSQMIRMSVISSNDRDEAIKMLRRARKEIEPQSWLYLYNKH